VSGKRRKAPTDQFGLGRRCAAASRRRVVVAPAVTLSVGEDEAHAVRREPIDRPHTALQDCKQCD
jgi:hypothetical protein